MLHDQTLLHHTLHLLNAMLRDAKLTHIFTDHIRRHAVHLMLSYRVPQLLACLIALTDPDRKLLLLWLHVFNVRIKLE